MKNNNKINGGRPEDLFVVDELDETLKILGKKEFLELYEKSKPKINKLISKSVIIFGTKGDL